MSRLEKENRLEGPLTQDNPMVLDGDPQSSKVDEEEDLDFKLEM